MDIKIRTQDKMYLSSVGDKHIGVGGYRKNQVILLSHADGSVAELGTYKDKEECIKVIDLIEYQIEKAYKENKSGIIIAMP